MADDGQEEETNRILAQLGSQRLVVDRFIGNVIRDVAELPDRNSPEDWPEAMLVTSNELRAIISDRLVEAGLGFIADEVLDGKI
jgi:hypothetical protein